MKVRSVLVACEFSGVVRNAFLKKGWDAVSCDLVPAIDGGPHIQGDAVNAIYSRSWDMVIAHPPCTYLCSSGLHWNKRRPERQQQTEDAIKFVEDIQMACWETFIDLTVIENPIGCLSTRVRKPDQIIQPWQFGHPESKATCLWLNGLPKLTPTNILVKPESGRWDNQTPTGQNKLGPSKDRANLRSITYQGIADAMAEQWTKAYEEAHKKSPSG